MRGLARLRAWWGWVLPGSYGYGLPFYRDLQRARTLDDGARVWRRWRGRRGGERAWGALVARIGSTTRAQDPARGIRALVQRLDREEGEMGAGPVEGNQESRVAALRVWWARERPLWGWLDTAWRRPYRERVRELLGWALREGREREAAEVRRIWAEMATSPGFRGPEDSAEYWRERAEELAPYREAVQRMERELGVDGPEAVERAVAELWEQNLNRNGPGGTQP